MAASHVANSDTFNASTPSDREIVLTRLFDAPKNLVFEALTKPEHVRQWWGILDDRYSVIQCDIDLRPGGAWKFVGKHPQGTVCFYGVYREIKPPDRLVFTEIYEPFPHVESVVTSVLTTEHGKTRMTVTALYPNKDVRDTVIQSGMEKGAAKSYNKLEEVASALQA